MTTSAQISRTASARTTMTHSQSAKPRGRHRTRRMLPADVWDHGGVLSRIGHRARGSAPRPARSRFALHLALIAAAGLAARLVYVLIASRDLRGTGDSDYFYVLGGLIADGHGFSDSFVFQLSGEYV